MPPRVLASGPKACGGNRYNRVFILHSNYNLTGLWYFSIGQQFSKGFSFHILYRVCTHVHHFLICKTIYSQKFSFHIFINGLYKFPFVLVFCELEIWWTTSWYVRFPASPSVSFRQSWSPVFLYKKAVIRTCLTEENCHRVSLEVKEGKESWSWF